MRSCSVGAMFQGQRHVFRLDIFRHEIYTLLNL